MTPDTDPPRRVRGRPRRDARIRVTEQLLEAAERLLKDCSHIELSERRIAAEAGVDEAMIRYYFGSKDGLLLDLTLRHCDEIEEQIAALDGYGSATPAVTQRIINALIEAYFSKPWIIRIMVLETTRKDSLIRSRFIERFGPVGAQGLVAGPVRALVERLQQAGIYRRDADAAQTALSMIAAVTGPLLIAPLSGDTETSLRQFRSASWLAHLTSLFESRLLQAADPATLPGSAGARRKR